MTDAPILRRAAIISTCLSLASFAAVAALLRWSAWWPHPDMRQGWAFAATGLAAVVAITASVIALVQLPQRHRGTFLVLAGASAAVGAVGGFALLRWMTEWAR